MILLLALQVAAAAPHRLSPKDSAKLVGSMRDAELRLLLDWRHEWEAWRKDVAVQLQQVNLLNVQSRIPEVIKARYSGSCPPPAVRFGSIGEGRIDVGLHDQVGRFVLGKPGTTDHGTPLYYCLH